MILLVILYYPTQILIFGWFYHGFPNVCSIRLVNNLSPTTQIVISATSQILLLLNLIIELNFLVHNPTNCAIAKRIF